MNNVTHRRLTFLASLDDLAAVRTEYPAALDGVILAHDPDVHIALRTEGVAHITPWDIFDADEHVIVRDFLQRILAAWDAFGRIPYGGMDLLRIARYRHVAALTRMAWATCVIRRCLERIPAAEVCVFDDDNGHALDQPADHRHMPIFHALARGIAEQAGIPVRALRRDPSARFLDACAAKADASTNRTIAGGIAIRPDLRIAPADKPASLNAIEATGRMSLSLHPQPGNADFANASHRFQHSDPVGAAGWPPRRDYILFHANGTDLLRQDRLIKALGDDGGFDIAQLYRIAEPDTIDTLRATGSQLWCESHFLDLFDRPPPFDFDPSHAYSRFRSEIELLPPDLKSVFSNPRAAFHFEFVFGEYAFKLRRHVDVWQAFFRRSRPALLVAGYHAPIVDVAVACGVSTLMLTHGLMLLGDTSWYTSLPSCHVGAISRRHAERLVASAIPQARIHITGDPGVSEVMSAARERQSAKDATGERERLRVRLGVPVDGRLVLLVTSDLGSPSKQTRLPITNFNAAVEAVESIAGIIDHHPDWTFALRPHPRYDHRGVFDRLVRSTHDTSRLRLIGVETDHCELMPAVDAIVVMNVMTSAIMELSFWHKPLILLASAMPWYDADTWGTRDWRHVTSVADLESTLTSVLQSATGFSEGVEQTRRGLSTFFDGEPFDPIASTKDVIQSIAKCGSPSRSAPMQESALR